MSFPSASIGNLAQASKIRSPIGALGDDKKAGALGDDKKQEYSGRTKSRSTWRGEVGSDQSPARRISQTTSAAVRSQIATMTPAAIFPIRVALPTISSDF